MKRPPYDRSQLRYMARQFGDTTPAALAQRLGVCAMTGWRLWHGHSLPNADICARVQAQYGLPAALLCVPAGHELAGVA